MDRRSAYLQALGIDQWVSRRPAVRPVGTPEPDLAAAAPTVPAVPAVPVTDPPVVAHAPSIAAAGWDVLEAAVRDCRGCGLHATRTLPVFGVGNRSAAWMVIGEAPGAEEDLRGEPFVGRAGGLLDAMLRGIGLDRGEVYIANILKSRPPGNRDPRPDEVSACLPYLLRQIELVRPRILLAVGRIAGQNLLGTDEPLARLRGRVHRYGPMATPLVITYHPSYLLRSPAEKRKAWEDLKLARDTCRDALAST